MPSSCVNLAITNQLLFQSRDDYLSEFLNVLYGLDIETKSITNIESFDNPIEELRDETVERRLGDMSRVTAHYENSLEFGLTTEKSVEKLSKPSDGKEGVGQKRSANRSLLCF